VQSHAHPDGAICEGALAVLGRSDRIGCAAEGDEERVTLGIDLDAVVRGEGGTEASAMLVQGISVTVAESLQQTSGALHVREKQGDDTCGQITHRGENHLPVGALCLPAPNEVAFELDLLSTRCGARITRNHAAQDAPENRGVAGSIPALATQWR
jgi:hypothetical protein